MAARHVRSFIEWPARNPAVDYVQLSSDDLWQDTFYSIIDEIDSAATLDHFLLEILSAGGRARMRIAAYAIKTRGAELRAEVRAAYEKASLADDLVLTPAA